MKILKKGLSEEDIRKRQNERAKAFDKTWAGCWVGETVTCGWCECKFKLCDDDCVAIKTSHPNMLGPVYADIKCECPSCRAECSIGVFQKNFAI